MAIQDINIGTTPNDGTGDTLRDAGGKINNNNAEYSTLITNLDNNKLETVSTNSDFNGDGTSGSPLSLANNYLQNVNTDATLTGDGTSGSPLSVVDNYTEEFSVINLTVDNAWHTVTVPNAPSNKKILVTITVNTDNQDAGVREVGSTLDRRINIGENNFGVSSITMDVKTNSSGEIQVYSGFRLLATFTLLSAK